MGLDDGPHPALYQPTEQSEVRDVNQIPPFTAQEVIQGADINQINSMLQGLSKDLRAFIVKFALNPDVPDSKDMEDAAQAILDLIAAGGGGVADLPHRIGNVYSAVITMGQALTGIGLNQIRTDVIYAIPFLVPNSGNYDGVLIGGRAGVTPWAGTERVRVLVYNGDAANLDPDTLAQDVGTITAPVAASFQNASAIKAVTSFTLAAGFYWVCSIVSTDFPSDAQLESAAKLDPRFQIGHSSVPASQQSMPGMGRAVRQTGTTGVAATAPANFPGPIITIGEELTEAPHTVRLQRA